MSVEKEVAVEAGFIDHFKCCLQSSNRLVGVRATNGATSNCQRKLFKGLCRLWGIPASSVVIHQTPTFHFWGEEYVP
jgi:hypothetical protein